MSKIFLLTGASGFVGRQILSNLLKKKIKVRVIVREGKENLITNKEPDIQIVKTKDLFKENVDWWTEQCNDIDTVIHAAWYVEPGKYLQSSKNIDCLIGSLNLAKGSIKAGIKRFVGIGTCFEYDLDYPELNTNAPLKPTTPYGAAKVGLFTSLLKLLHLYSIEFSWCRLFYLYGEGEDERRLIPYINKQLLKGENVELTSGEQIRDFLDVSEAGKMITEIALDNRIGAVNICSGIPITVRQLAEKIADKYGRRDLLKFGARPDNLVDPKRVVGLK